VPISVRYGDLVVRIEAVIPGGPTPGIPACRRGKVALSFELIDQGSRSMRPARSYEWFAPPGFGLTVKMLCRAKPQTLGGRGTLGKQGTGAGDGFCLQRANNGILARRRTKKPFVSVNRGTAFCAFCRKPRMRQNRNVLSFLIGKPTVPPYCWRLKLSFIGEPKVSGLAGLKVCPGCNAWLKENGFAASNASLRKNPLERAVHFVRCRTWLQY